VFEFVRGEPYVWNMKHFEKIAICLAGVLALNASLRADSVPLSDNPYALVVARNIFGLNPPVVVENTAPVEPPVKITPNGIMSILGQVQVLFKVAGKTPGKEDSYILSEGQRQDDIEVVKIDEKNGVVTFNNHGLEQILPLAAASANSMPTPTSVGGNPGMTGMSGIPTSGHFGNSGFNNAFGGRSRTGAAAVNNPAGDNDSNLRPIPTRNSVSDASSQIPPGMTPEIQTIAIEANRVATQAQVDSGELPPLPVTEITPPDATGSGGAPLVVPSPETQPQ
jgi:hypothetical protein